MSWENIKKRIRFLLPLVAAIITLSGCGNGVLFVDNQEKTDALSPVKNRSMQTDVLYAKDGTIFYPLSNALEDNGKAAGNSPSPESDYILTSEAKFNTLPTLFKGETLCIRTRSSTGLSSLQMERYKDLGWTIGISGLQYNEDLKYYSAESTKMMEGSSLYLNLAKPVGQNAVSIAAIGNEAPAVSKAGTVMDLQKGKTYAVNVFVGTESDVFNITADSKILESSECFTIKDTKLTEYGYLKFSMPDKLKSGYYKAGSYGMFRYIDKPKYDWNEKEAINYNEPNRFSDITYAIDDTIEKTSTTKKVDVDIDADQLNFSFNYNTQGVSITAMSVTYPNGKHIDLSDKKDSMSVSLSDVVKGTYEFSFEGYNVDGITVSPQINEATPTPTPTATPTPTEPPKPTATPAPVTPTPTEPPKPTSPPATPEPAKPAATPAPTQAPAQTPQQNEDTQNEVIYTPPTTHYYEEYYDLPETRTESTYSYNVENPGE